MARQRSVSRPDPHSCNVDRICSRTSGLKTTVAEPLTRMYLQRSSTLSGAPWEEMTQIRCEMCLDSYLVSTCTTVNGMEITLMNILDSEADLFSLLEEQKTDIDFLSLENSSVSCFLISSLITWKEPMEEKKKQTKKANFRTVIWSFSSPESFSDIVQSNKGCNMQSNYTEEMKKFLPRVTSMYNWFVMQTRKIRAFPTKLSTIQMSIKFLESKPEH